MLLKYRGSYYSPLVVYKKHIDYDYDHDSKHKQVSNILTKSLGILTCLWNKPRDWPKSCFPIWQAASLVRLNQNFMIIFNEKFGKCALSRKSKSYRLNSFFYYRKQSLQIWLLIARVHNTYYKKLCLLNVQIHILCFVAKKANFPWILS